VLCVGRERSCCVRHTTNKESRGTRREERAGERRRERRAWVLLCPSQDKQREQGNKEKERESWGEKERGR
jgi:hypothetical protein